MALKRKQGDSLWVDVTGEGIEEVDATWDNWTGSWAIVPELGQAAVISGTMTKTATAGQFRVRIGSTLMAGLSVRNYVLVCQVENTTVDYRQEIAQEKLTITAQGITP